MKDYNFFEFYNKKKDIEINPKSTVFIGLILLVLLILASMGAVGRNLYTAHQIKDLTADTELLKISEEYIEAQKVQISVNALKEYDKNAEIALSKFEMINILGTDTLTRVSSAIPAGVKLDRMNTGHVVTSFSFIVPDRTATAELMTNLNTLDLFHNVHLVSITLNQDKLQYTANIECLMKAGDENE